MAEPIDTEREAREALASFDQANTVPPCRLCGKPLTLQAADAFSRTWACEGGDWRNGRWSAFDDAPERTMADAHYSRSSFEQRPDGMAEHLRAVLALLAAERLARQTAERERDTAVDAFHRARIERDEARAMAPRWVREGRASTLRVGKVALARVESYRDNAGFVYRVTAGGTLVATGIIHQADAFRAACVAVGIPEVPRG